MNEPTIQADAILDESMELKYFSTPGRTGLIQQVAYVLQFGEGIPVVHGSAASGKSFIAAELASTIDTGLETVTKIDVAPGSGLEALLHQVTNALSIPSDSTKSCGELLVQLRRYTRDLVLAEKLAVLILDDAHHLDSPSLGALISLVQGEVEANCGLRLAFFARPGLVEKIDQLQVVDVAVYDFDVPMMSLSEMGHFLRDFYPEYALLSDAELKNVWSEVRGNPGLALSILKETQSKSSAPFKFALPKIDFTWPSISPFHLSFLAILIVAFVWAVLVRDTSGRPSNGPGQVPVTASEATAFGASSENTPAEQTEGLQVAKDNEYINDLEKSGAVKVVAENELVVAAPAVETIAAPTAVPTKVPTAVPTPKPTPQTVAVNRPAPKKSFNSALSEDEKFLLSQPSQYYAVQVLSASLSKSLSSYLARQDNRRQLYLYRGNRRGVQRYIIVAGVFPSKQEAMAAINRLPLEQRKAGPWPRPLKAIQNEIKTF